MGYIAICLDSRDGKRLRLCELQIEIVLLIRAPVRYTTALSEYDGAFREMLLFNLCSGTLGHSGSCPQPSPFSTFQGAGVNI